MSALEQHGKGGPHVLSDLLVLSAARQEGRRLPLEARLVLCVVPLVALAILEHAAGQLPLLRGHHGHEAERQGELQEGRHSCLGTRGTRRGRVEARGRTSGGTHLDGECRSVSENKDVGFDILLTWEIPLGCFKRALPPSRAQPSQRSLRAQAILPRGEESLSLIV